MLLLRLAKGTARLLVPVRLYAWRSRRRRTKLLLARGTADVTALGLGGKIGKLVFFWCRGLLSALLLLLLLGYVHAPYFRDLCCIRYVLPDDRTIPTHIATSSTRTKLCPHACPQRLVSIGCRSAHQHTHAHVYTSS